MDGAFASRAVAGRTLALLLRAFAARKDVIVLALPRGGVAVGVEVAARLRVPFDILIVRKLGVPGQEELAMGAVASGGIELRDAMTIAALNVPTPDVEAIVSRERAEVERRERLYRGTRPEPQLGGKTVILIDDGIATGASMRVAVRAVRTKHPHAIVVAAPVASSQAVALLRPEVSEVITLVTAAHFVAVGDYYRDFHQLTDAEVEAALTASWSKSGTQQTAATSL